jgi:hypothetical protein
MTSSDLLHTTGDYFSTTSGQAVYLAGDHTWADNTSYSRTGQFGLNSYLSTLQSEGDNLIRYWAPDSTAMMATDADWIARTGGSIYQSNAPAATGAKVLVADTDHIFGMGGNANWAWQQFTRGNNVLMMDDEAGTNLPGVLNTSISGGALSNEISERLGVAETRTVSQMVNMTAMTPDGGLSSTGFALANQVAGDYVVYAPDGGGLTVDLSGAARKRSPRNGSMSGLAS